MKKRRKSTQNEERRHRFVFKKFNKQLVSVVGATLLLIGNYSALPLQAFANETATTQSSEAVETESSLSTIATEEPTVQSTEREPIKPVEESTTEESTSEAPSEKPVVKQQAKKQTGQQRALQSGDWEYIAVGGVAVIKNYTGDPTDITVPSEIDGKSVEIDLEGVLGTALESQTIDFKIETSKPGLEPVRVTGTFKGLFSEVRPLRHSPIQKVSFGDADTSAIMDMSFMFYRCRNLTNVDVSQMDTSKVATMFDMFTGCSTLRELDLSSFNTSEVTNMGSMFSGCSALNELDLSSFNTAKVINMHDMFSGCSTLRELDLSSFNTAEVTNVMDMFRDCSTLRELDLSSFNTLKVWDLNGMFYGCGDLTKLMLTKNFKFKHSHYLRNLPYAENAGKTTSHWVKDEYATDYNSTNDFVSAHNELTDDLVHTYTIQRKHQVTFDLAGGSGGPILEQRIFENKLVADPNYSGTKAHHQFGGWYAGESPFNIETDMVTAPLDLTVKWLLDTYTVRFHDNTEQGLMSTQSFTYDEEKGLTLNDFSKVGYTFKEWNTEKGGTGGKTYSNGESVKNLTTENGAYFDLYAQWQANKYTITFERNGGEGTMTPLEMTYDVEKSLTKNEFTREGYDFKEWNTQANGQGKPYGNKEPVENVTSENNTQVPLYAQWEATVYTINFDSQGGNNISDQTYTIERGIETLPEPNKTGYTFLGWYDEKGKVENIADGETGARKLEAKWSANQYTLTFNPNGGTGQMDSLKMTYDQAETLPENKFKKRGYTFKAWNTQANGQGKTYGNKEPVENVTSENNVQVPLYAQWEIIHYKVTFDSQGGNNISDKTYTIEKGIEILPKPNKTGYTFLGWYNEENQEVTKIPDNSIGDMDLTAKWEATEYTVDFESNGGSAVESKSYTIEKGIPKFPTPTRKGYTFLGWYEEDKKVITIQNGETGDRKLTAKWKVEEYTITFDDPTLSPIKYTIEDETITLPAVTKTGYTFQGWQDGDDLITEVQKGSTGNKHLMTKWEVHQYTLTFDKNSGEGTMTPFEMTYDEEKTLPENKFTKRGYTFKEWNTQADGQGKTYGNKESVKNVTSENNMQVPLYAQWEIINYTVEFDSQGGNDISDQTYTVEQGIGSFPTPSKTGYTFLGWYDVNDDVKSSIETGEIGDRTLKAKWQAINYTVDFESNGGSVVNSDSYTIEKGIPKFPTPTRKGYTFLGWYKENTKVEAIPDGETGDLTLTAKWEIEEYTIAFDDPSLLSIPYTIESDTINLPTLVKKGYTFQGWQDGENLITEVPKGSTGDKELTAQWKIDDYTITFDSAGGSDIAPESYTIKNGFATLPKPIRKGYTFKGWYEGETEVESISAGETGDRTLKAQWEIIHYTITFDDPELSPISYTVESEAIKLPIKTRKGYTFLGWLVSEETLKRAVTDIGKVVQEIQAGTTGNLRLSAQWQANHYSIHFDPNGGTGEMTDQAINYDEAAKLSANKFTRADHAFVGWNTQADGKGTTYTDAQEIRNLAEKDAVTLYAQWKPTKTALIDLINEEKNAKRDKEQYTEDSWKQYETALANAEKVLADEHATPEQVRTALEGLKGAIKNLKPIIPTSTKTPSSSLTTVKSYPTATAKSYPRTGMLTGSGLLIVGLGAVGAALTGWKRRQKK